MSTLGISLDRARYAPDPAEPVDRWFQAHNASNVRTTTAILTLLGARSDVVVVDPFAGGGSTAVAARLLGMRFFGIEHDPLLACVCLAKSSGHARHAELLPQTTMPIDAALADIAARVAPADAQVVSALAVVTALRAERGQRVDAELLAGDLATSPATAPPGRVVCEDATSPRAWAALDPPRAPALVYTSPPFGSSSPTVVASVELRAAAAAVMGAQRVTPAPTRPFLDLTVQMLGLLVAHLGDGRLVVEHEPDDDGRDSTEALCERVRTELGTRLRLDAVDRYDSFSPRGPFTLISVRLQRSTA